METKRVKIKREDIETVLKNFETTFNMEFSEEILTNVSSDSKDGFSALNDFYEEFNEETKEKEQLLQHKLCKGVITQEEFNELEAIAIVKYPDIKFEQIADFYKFAGQKDCKDIIFTIEKELETI